MFGGVIRQACKSCVTSIRPLMLTHIHDGCSLMEQKVNELMEVLTRRQQEREDTALQYKRCVYCWD